MTVSKRRPVFAFWAASFVPLLALLIFIVYTLSGLLFCSFIPTVTLTHAVQTKVYNRVPLSGTITAGTQNELVCKLPLVPSRVLVSTGDTVQAGQTVALIDQKQSLRTAASLYAAYRSLSASSQNLSLLSELSAYSAEELADLIPSRLTAPASGTVLFCSLQSGAVLTPGVSVLSVSDCTELYASLSVDESEAAQLSEGDALLLKSQADAQNIYTAYVTQIAPAATQTLSGTTLQNVVQVTARLTQTGILKPGYSIYGYRFSDVPTEYLLLPLHAVFQQDTVEYVYCLKNGTAQKTVISTDGLYDGQIIVSAGITAQDIVIVSETEPTNEKMIRFQKENSHA